MKIEWVDVTVPVEYRIAGIDKPLEYRGSIELNVADSIELDEWVKQNNCWVEGLAIVLPDEQTALLFTLRWK